MTMSKALMPARPRALLLALFCGVLLALSCVATAPAVTVNLQIESLTDTVFNGQVDVTAGPVKQTASSTCADDGSVDATSTTASSIRALAVWAAGNAGDYNTSNGAFVCRIAGIAGNASQYWLMKVNNKTLIAPGDWWIGSSPLHDGDSVLWYFTDDYAKKTLALNVPSTVQAGTAVQASVSAYDGNDDSKSAAAGVAISGGGASATSAADGSFSLTFPAPGRFLVTATKSGVIRTSAWVTVTTEPVPVPPTLKQLNQTKRSNARAACRAAYPTKSGKTYRDCIRAANKIGHRVTKLERRILARAKCVQRYPHRGTPKRVRCVRIANRIGR